MVSYGLNPMQVYEIKNEVVYSFFFHGYLGDTLAIKEGRLACRNSTNGDVTLVIYEGPLVELAMIEMLLPRLQKRQCGQSWNATNVTVEVMGRIGDLTAVLYVDKRHQYFLTLGFAVRDICEVSSVTLCKVFNLGDKPSSIRFDESGTFFYKLSIDASQNGFVRIIFSELTLVGYEDNPVSCTNGGIFITHRLTDGTTGRMPPVGRICSQRGFKQFERLYGIRGLTLSRRVLIHVKQYGFLTQIHGKLTFSVDHCFGWVNLLSASLNDTGRYIKKIILN